MNDLDEWERFALTGKIEDYLKYASHREQIDAGVRKNDISMTKEQEPETYAGFTDSDRTHTESGTHRGI